MTLTFSRIYDALENLLAVIHRDGGHHTAEVGLGQSCKDAETEVIKMWQADFYWDDDNPEGAYDCIEDVIEGCDIEDIITIRPIKELPTLEILVTSDGFDIIE